MAADYCLPAAVMCLEPYLCVEATSLLAGIVNGYNINFFESAITGTADYHDLGMAIDGVLNFLPSKVTSNTLSKVSQLAANVAAKELSGVAANTLATKASKWFSWFKSSAPINQTVQKTTQVAERLVAKEGMNNWDQALN